MIFNTWHTTLLITETCTLRKKYYMISSQPFHFVFELSFESIGAGLLRISFNHAIIGIPWQLLEKHSFGEQIHMLREEREKF